MKKTVTILTLASACLLAHAHVTLEHDKAPVGTYQKLTFRVGHGCGNSATTAIKVQIPSPIAWAKPTPKAGWTISAMDAAQAKTGQAAGMKEITWQGGPLLNAHYDEFNMQVHLPATPGKLYFKVIQMCEVGQMNWTEVDDAGEAEMKMPAPVLEVTAALKDGHAKHH